jgi:hypothetical protein
MRIHRPIDVLLVLALVLVPAAAFAAEAPAAAAPAVEPAAPAAAPAAPANEAAAPAAPAVEAAAPTTAPAAPVTEAVAPVTEAVAPVTEAVTPAAEAVAPSVAPVAPAAALVAQPASAPVKPALVYYEKAKIVIDGEAQANGSLEMVFAPQGGESKTFMVTVLNKASKKDVARDIHKELSLLAGSAYKVKLDNEKVRISKANKQTPNCSISFDKIALAGVSLRVEKD